MPVIRPVRLVQRGQNYQIYYYTPEGVRRRLSAGNSLLHAQRMASRFTDMLLEGKDPESVVEHNRSIEMAGQITLRQLFVTFMDRHGALQSKSMQTICAERFKCICRCPQLADIPLVSITKGLVLNYMHARMKKDGVSPSTVNREGALVRSMLNRAQEWDIIQANPVQGLKLLKEPDRQRVELSPEQAATLVRELPEPIGNIVLFAIYSGFRRENILGLKIESITFHDITNTAEVDMVIKGGHLEKFPLGHLAVDVLKKVIAGRKSGYVFLSPKTGSRYTTITHTFDRAVRKLNLTINGGQRKLCFHSLRHVYASWLVRSGVSLDAIRVLLGHLSRSVTDRYAFYNRMEAGQFLDRLPEIPDLRRGKNAAAS